MNDRLNDLDGRPIRLYHPFSVINETYLNIAHVCDPHIAARWNKYEQNLKGATRDHFNNYNQRYKDIIEQVDNSTTDIIIMTGDLIDYNRGYVSGPVWELDDFKWNMNWLYFYKLLLEKYKKPVFLTLGNHDWRFNPYHPIPTLGDKRMFELHSISYDLNLTREEVKKAQPEDATDLRLNALKIIDESVAWYCFVINPFLDYSFFFGKMGFLLLDWRDEEKHLTYPIIAKDTNLTLAGKSVDEHQKRLLNQFLKIEKWDGNDIDFRVFGAHAALVSPYPFMADDLLERGLVVCPACNGTGEIHVAADRHYPVSRTFSCSTCKTKGRLSLEISTYQDSDGETILRRARPTQGSFHRNRNWLIVKLRDARPRVKLVLGGHVHRSSVLKTLHPSRASLVSDNQLGSKAELNEEKHFPLYVNTVSAGPNGFVYRKQGSQRKLCKPGYRLIQVDSSGQIKSLVTKEVGRDISPEAQKDFLGKKT